jgi:3-oxoacyl-[acyl-carrier protein] reductase
MKTVSVGTPLLKNKRAVIFGAGGAIGQAVAKEFAAQGAMVFLSGRRLAAIEQVAQEIHQDGGVAYAAQVDALDEQAVHAYLDRVAQEGGSIDILLNATGPQPKDFGNGTSTLELPLEQFLLPLSTLVPSQFITARAAARHMVRQHSGVILFVTAIPARGGTKRHCYWLGLWCHGSALEMSCCGSGAFWSQSTWHSFRGHGGDQNHPAVG